MRDIRLWTRHLLSLKRFRETGDALEDVDIESLLAESRRQLARVGAPGYLKELEGTIGADPSYGLGD